NLDQGNAIRQPLHTFARHALLLRMPLSQSRCPLLRGTYPLWKYGFPAAAALMAPQFYSIRRAR
ncbi:hypothetical protein, partial [Rhizobium sophorae]|uniref:hypothetical protein n=1 Tax=Rhizobium sophorae TaxID=1535242 RepID=UPI001AED39F1